MDEARQPVDAAARFGGRLRGLTSEEASARRREFGPNALPQRVADPLWWRFVQQFRSPLIYILVFALGVDLVSWTIEGAHGVPIESVAIAVILLLNAGLGVWQEHKAEAALSALGALAVPHVWVFRDGRWREIPSPDVVPGDAVRVEAGDRVPADLLLASEALSVDESVLTGESLPVDKARGEELSSGTLVSYGTAYAEVVRTGPQSALGRLAAMLGAVEREETPLERRLRVFGHRVARWVLVIAALLVVEGLVTDGFEHLGRIFLFAVALAVAAVPEGLPAILTSTLALGVERMARRRAVVRRLTAVEALGSVTVIATDKTGTLTENRMEVRVVDSPDPDRALDALLLANDADAGAGDPMDVALVAYGQSRLDVTALRAARPRVSARPFDAGQKFTRATVDEAGREVSYLKGAPEVLLGRSTLAEPDRRQWADRALGYAQDGFRVLGIAAGEGTREEALEFLGLVTFWDPPRPEVAEAIRRAREAGIRVLMITGDHPATARSIAAQVGIQGGHVLTGDEVEAMGPEAFAAAVADAHVFARVRPEHKLRLVEALQAAGAIVAVTGDGVNDAPALKKADVGVAMGQRGSDVSREVADLVLLDDNFATIVAAIEEGRSIYENVQKFIRFLFSTNLSEVIVVASGVLIAALLGLRDADGAVLLPLTAVQILWINLVTDGLPALSLALDRNPEVLQRGPREPSAPLLDRLSIEFVVSSGTVKAGMALAVLGLAFWGVLGREEARTATFHFMSVAQLFFAFPARHTDTRPLPNPTLVAAVVAGGLIQVLVGTVPQAASVLGCVLLPAWMWAGIIVLSLAAWGVAELVNRALWQGAPSRSRHAST